MSGGLIPYLDSFDATALPIEERLFAAKTVLPRLLASLEGANLVPYVGHDLDIVAAIQAENGDRMKLASLLNPRFFPNENDRRHTATVVLRREGQVAATASVRLRWIERSLAEEMESLRFFYGEHHRAANNLHCIVTAPTARAIETCHVVYSCGFFAAKSEAATDAGRAVIRLAHLWALANWRWSWLIGRAKESIARSFTHRVYRVTASEPSIWVLPDGATLAEREHETFLIHAKRPYVRDQLLRAGVGDPEFVHGTPSAAQLRRHALAQHSMSVGDLPG